MTETRSDIEIARAAKLEPIEDVGAKLGLRDELIPYGRNKAKIDLKIIDRIRSAPTGRLILVTAISPTPAGEGKMTTTVGLGDAFARLGKKAVICLRDHWAERGRAR